MQLQGPALASPAAPLNQLLRLGLDRDPDAIAVVSIVRSMTWRELENESSALACGYRRLGLRDGDRISSLMPNRIDLVVHYLACFKAGLVATPLNYRYTYREIDHALRVSGADALLAHVERGEDVGASALAAGLRCGVIAYRDEIGEHPVSWPHSFGELLGAPAPLKG
jgi:long-chain acyl-CoA synthetase